MNTKNEDENFWIKAYKETQKIIFGNYPQEEKDKLLELGCAEMVFMMYDGILSKNIIK